MPDTTPPKFQKSRIADLYLENGERAGEIPTALSAKLLRTLYVKCNVAGADEFTHPLAITFREDLIRAQVPWLCTLLVYKSKFQMEPEKLEMLVYAPPRIGDAVQLSVRMWQRWFRPQRDPDAVIEDLANVYPRVDDAAVAEPLPDDKEWDSHWKYVMRYNHKCAGDPRDPYVFTSLNPEVKLFRVADFQAGLHVRA